MVGMVGGTKETGLMRGLLETGYRPVPFKKKKEPFGHRGCSAEGNNKRDIKDGKGTGRRTSKS